MANSSDSNGIYVYNNLSDGNWGTCCTTSSFLFIEHAIPDSVYVFNNVVIGLSGENNSPATNEGATLLDPGQGNVSWYNNTLLGAGTSGLASGVLIYNTGTGFTFENNADQGYGQYLVGPSGPYNTLDYNTYGSHGESGNAPWSCGTGQATFAGWQSGCTADIHGQKVSDIGVSSTTGYPTSGSPLILAGANLTSLCSGNLAALCSDYAGKARPTAGGWTAGAYQVSVPNPPTNVTATPH
jgi:hypothetical protein